MRYRGRYWCCVGLQLREVSFPAIQPHGVILLRPEADFLRPGGQVPQRLQLPLNPPAPPPCRTCVHHVLPEALPGQGQPVLLPIVQNDLLTLSYLATCHQHDKRASPFAIPKDTAAAVGPAVPSVERELVVDETRDVATWSGVDCKGRAVVARHVIGLYGPLVCPAVGHRVLLLLQHPQIRADGLGLLNVFAGHHSKRLRVDKKLGMKGIAQAAPICMAHTIGLNQGRP